MPPGLEENTLGLVVGPERPSRRRDGGRRDGFRRAQRTIFTTQAQQDSLGTGYLGTGLTSVGLTVVAFLFLFFVLTLGAHPHPVLSSVAWLVLGATLVATGIAVRMLGRRLPGWLYALFVTGLAATTALDVAAVWGSTSAAAVPAAAAATGAALVAVVTLRGLGQIIATISVLALAQFASAISQLGADPEGLGLRVIALVVTVACPVISLIIIRAFRRMVQVEVDRALVQSTVSGPQYAVGMLASEELARLDLAAERLLADVADGALRLPLDPERAEHASSLAMQLRLHLIEGRRETWLHHAITESEFLGPFVTIEDPSGDAGLLSQGQRDGLLSAAWLFLRDTTGANPTLHIEIGATSSGPSSAPPGKLALPITIATTGVPRRRVDPATWEAIEQVGRFVDSSRDGNVHVEIDSLVDNPTNR